MKRIICLLLALSLAALLPLAALADEDRTITVIGEAHVSVPADIAVVSLGVETTAGVVAEATSANAAAIDQVLAALTSAGIDRKDIVTDYFYVDTIYDYSVEESANRGYQVRNTLSVTVRKLEEVGKVIDLALAAGANSCSGISFQCSQAAAAGDEALTAAVAEGRRKAQLLAEAAGLSLGKLLTITESYAYSSGVSFAKNANYAAEASTTILADLLDYSATVTLCFELKN